MSTLRRPEEPIIRQLGYLALIGLVACSSPGRDVPTSSDVFDREAARVGPPHHHAPGWPANHPLPLRELARARAATARYHNVEAARADGYVDLGVVLPNMGRHFLKESLVDGVFEADHPELLVYSADDRGALNLVAVEYAIPLPLTAEAPEGFVGQADEWFGDTRFGLWTLHAWVWRNNPEGVFHPTNRRVP